MTDNVLHAAPVLGVRDLSHSYTKKRRILRAVDFSVAAGESLAIMGRSGSGKSTLLGCLMGMIKPTTGSVTVDGTDIVGLNRAQRARFRSTHLGVTFQHGELIGSMSAEENVALPALIATPHDKKALPRARALLEELGVPATTRADVLSGGEQQRTALARALINEPPLLLADEPTGSLDTEIRDAAADLLFAVPKQRECALIVVTHDPAVAARADRAFRLEDGQLSAFTV